MSQTEFADEQTQATLFLEELGKKDINDWTVEEFGQALSAWETAPDLPSKLMDSSVTLSTQDCQKDDRTIITDRQDMDRKEAENPGELLLSNEIYNESEEFDMSKSAEATPEEASRDKILEFQEARRVLVTRLSETYSQWSTKERTTIEGFPRVLSISKLGKGEYLDREGLGSLELKQLNMKLRAEEKTHKHLRTVLKQLASLGSPSGD